MSWRIDIKNEFYKQLIRKKEQEKIKYNEKVEMQYFMPKNLVFFKDLTFNFEEFIK